MKKIYIIILNFNAWYDSIECIESVINSDYEEFQIVLIDNFSTNNSEEKLREWLEGKINFEITNNFFRNKISSFLNRPLPFVAYTANYSLKRDLENENLIYSNFTEANGKACVKNPILFIQTGKNLGFAGGNNVVLRYFISSEEDANIFLLNPDTFLEKNALSELNKCIKLSERFLMGLSIKSYLAPDILMSIGGNKLFKPLGIIKSITNYSKKNKLDYIYGAALFTNTRTLRFMGAMPEEYFLYWEETDWCYNAKNAGVALLTCPQAICYDKVGTSIGRGYLSEYFFTYNSMQFYKKYFKYYLISLFLFHLVRLSIKLIKLKFPQAKAIVIALTDFIFGARYEIK